MPRTLPINRSRGADGGEHDLDDPALLLFNDAGQHREPEAEDADEDEHRTDVGDEEAGLVGLGLRVEGLTAGGCCAAASGNYRNFLSAFARILLQPFTTSAETTRPQQRTKE